MFYMLDYVKKILSELPADMNGESATLAATYLFDVNPKSARLPEREAEFYHRMVAKLLFLCKQAIPDIQMTVAFLCTRVNHPDMDD